MSPLYLHPRFATIYIHTYPCKYNKFKQLNLYEHLRKMESVDLEINEVIIVTRYQWAHRLPL